MTATSHLVAHPTNRKWLITLVLNGINKGNVHFFDWGYNPLTTYNLGELTHLRFVGSSPPNSQVSQPQLPRFVPGAVHQGRELSCAVPHGVAHGAEAERHVEVLSCLSSGPSWGNFLGGFWPDFMVI
jgi:hypothetical protein